MIGRAESVKAALPSPAEFVVGDYTAMPFRQATFDYALFPKNIVECSHADFEQVLDEVRRIPGHAACCS